MVLVFGDRAFTEDFLAQFPHPVSHIAHDVVTATAALREQPSAVEVVVGFPGNEGIEFAVHAAELYRDRRFHLVLDDEDVSSGVWARAAARGIRVVGRKSAVADVAGMVGSAPGSLTSREAVDPPVLNAAEDEYLASKAAALRTLRRQRLSVYSIKGGVGKTAVAVNMGVYAASWARARGLEYRVVLVDGDIGGSQTAGDWLRIADVPQNLATWGSINLPGWDTVEKLLVRHSSGLYFLPSPPTPVEAEKVTGDLMLHVLGILDWYFDLVIVDMGTELKDDATLVTLQTSSTVLLIVSQELGVVRRTRRKIVDHAARLKINLAALRVVASRTRPGVPYGSSNIGRALGVASFPVEIPEDPGLLSCLNNPDCDPMVLSHPDSPFAAGIVALTGAVLGHEMFCSARGGKKGIMSFLDRFRPRRNGSRFLRKG